jgi:uncharacterized repeat protein (TIGR01451 family)
LTLQSLEDRTLPSISGFAYSGLSYDPNQGATPPDPIVAAGPTYVVEAVNQNLFFISKANLPNSISGTVQSFLDFFPGMTHSTFGLDDLISDPSVNYDTATGKWVISVLDIDLQNRKGYLDVGVSNTNDPTGGWNKFQLDLTDGHGPLIPGNAGSILWGDYDRFGSSADAYVWTVNMFTFSAGGIDQNSLYDHVQVIAVDKSNLAQINDIDLPGYDSGSGTITNENLLPVHMEGATAANGIWFAEETDYGTSSGQANSLRLVHVADPLTAAPADFVDFTGNVPLYNFIYVPDSSGGNHAWNNGDANTNAVQAGSSDLIYTNDTRMLSAVWRVVNGQEHLVLTQTVNSNADPGIAKARWYDFNTTGVTDPTAPVPLTASGEINPGAGVFTYFPSADIDPAGDIGMTYLESSSTESFSMYATGKQLSESAMEPGVFIAAGSALTGPDGSPHRAGDFSGTAVDVDANGNPTNAFWSANEFASGGNWNTELVNYTVPSTTSTSADLAVTASGPSSVTAGTNATYTVTLTNGGPDAAQTVVLTDTLPSGSSLVSITGAGGNPDTFSETQSGGTLTLTTSSMAAGNTDTFTIVVSAPSSLANGANFSDTAAVSSATSDPNTANNSATVTGSIVNNTASADLGVTATGPSSVLAGTNATYTFTITNAGPNAAQNFVLTDMLPTGSTFVSIAGGGANPDTFFYTQSGGTLTVTSSSIAPGNTDTLTVVVSAPSSLANGANFSDTVSVRSATFDPNTANNSATVTGSVVNSADLGVTATGPSSVTAGTNASYTFTITNAGPTAAQNFVLTDALPTGSTFVSITGGAANPDTFFYTQSGGTLTVTSSSIAAGNTDTLTIVVFAPSNLANGANFSDSVSVSSATFDPNTANNSATVTGSIVNNTPQSADLAVTNAGPATSTEGNNLTYTVTVTNNGPSAATSVVLTDTLGTNLKFVSATAGQGSFTQSGGVVNFSVGSVASGASVTFTVTARALEDGSLTNAATVSSAISDPNSGNNSASASTAVAEPPIVVSKPLTEKNRRVSGAVVATFTHAGGVEPTSAFVATINWGDGTTSVGTITLSGNTYRVTGSHTYAQSGTHTVTTTVTEPGAAPNLATNGTGSRSNTAVSKPKEFAADQLSIAMSLYLQWEKLVGNVPSGMPATLSTSLPRPGSDSTTVAVSGSVGSWNPAVDAAFRILAGETANGNVSDSYSIRPSHFETLFDFKPSRSL